jgi:hypothetical protein
MTGQDNQERARFHKEDGAHYIRLNRARLRERDNPSLEIDAH